jgi:hypothetical protein
MKELYNLFLFLFVIFLLILLFRNLNLGVKEGMATDSSGNLTQNIYVDNGIAGNSASYGASLKAATIKLQDNFLISKYKNDYETIILNLDDLINNLMLKSVLTFKQDNIDVSIKNLIELNQAKQALNNVMKFVDKN